METPDSSFVPKFNVKGFYQSLRNGDFEGARELLNTLPLRSPAIRDMYENTYKRYYKMRSDGPSHEDLLRLPPQAAAPNAKNKCIFAFNCDPRDLAHTPSSNDTSIYLVCYDQNHWEIKDRNLATVFSRPGHCAIELVAIIIEYSRGIREDALISIVDSTEALRAAASCASLCNSESELNVFTSEYVLVENLIKAPQEALDLSAEDSVFDRILNSSCLIAFASYKLLDFLGGSIFSDALGISLSILADCVIYNASIYVKPCSDLLRSFAPSTLLVGPHDRKKLHSIIKRRFNRIYQGNIEESWLIAGMATIPGREDRLVQAATSIASQVDVIFVIFNGAINSDDQAIKQVVDIENILLIESAATNWDMGDACKFLPCDFVPRSVYFSCDDDLIYPPDYCYSHLEAMNRIDSNYVTTFHGRTLKKDASSYYRDAEYYHPCLKRCTTDTVVAFPGTGVMAHKSWITNITTKWFLLPNMADIFCGIMLNRNGFKALALSHDAGWIKEAESIIPIEQANSIYHSASSIATHTPQDLLCQSNRINQVCDHQDLEKTVDFLVIIPYHNRISLVKDTLISVLNQSHQSWICVVIDDSSEFNQKASQLAMFNDNRIRLISLATNRGGYYACNQALKAFQGVFRYFLLLGSDDLLIPSALTTINTAFLNANTAHSICYQYRRVDMNLRTLNRAKYGDSAIAHSAQTFARLGYYDDTRFGGDTEYSLRLKKAGIKRIWIDKCLYIARDPGDQLTKKHSQHAREEYLERIGLMHSAMQREGSYYIPFS